MNGFTDRVWPRKLGKYKILPFGLLSMREEGGLVILVRFLMETLIN